jgi:glyoxylase-like metal-dependent hydrolase (beta-lactamase superfamily II)
MPEVLPSVHLIDLCFQGRRAALAAYLLVGPDGQAALIETGPTTTRAALLDGVRAAGVDPAGIADVLVTHIHLDHAGGAGALLRDDLPGARVLVHPAGLPHLVDPGKLVRSAARLYGARMDELWGEVAPVPAERVAALEDGARLRLAGHEIEVLFTPGHATHHAAVRHLASGAVFAGDVAGVRVPGAGVIHPPTVPPEFDPAAWELSIDRLLSLAPPLLLLAHFGPYTDARAHLAELRRCLREWTDFVRTGLAAGRTPAEMGAELQQRDATRPGTSPEGLNRLDLVAGYGMSVAGIARYLSRQ